MEKSIAVLTGGGCAPGLDPFLESVTKTLIGNEYRVWGIKYGWEGLIGIYRSSPGVVELTSKNVEGLVRSGGTLIGTSRANPFRDEESAQQALCNLKKLGVEGLIAAGGDDTLGVAEKLSQRGVNVIGVPKTMDLDLSGTDDSVGYESYIEAVFRDAVPGLISTLISHARVGVLEVFGRHSGFTVVGVGIPAGACYLAVPEFELDMRELIYRVERFYNLNNWALVVVGEAVGIGEADRAAIDDHGNELLAQRRTGEFLARQIEMRIGIETRPFQATHPFRGVASAHDSLLGFRLGLKAAEMVQLGQWGNMISVQGDEMTVVPISSFKPRRRITRDSWWGEIVQLRNQGKV